MINTHVTESGGFSLIFNHLGFLFALSSSVVLKIARDPGQFNICPFAQGNIKQLNYFFRAGQKFPCLVILTLKQFILKRSCATLLKVKNRAGNKLLIILYTNIFTQAQNVLSSIFNMEFTSLKKDKMLNLLKNNHFFRQAWS